jgi:hypothetical protein
MRGIIALFAQMRREYDFSETRENPYAARLNRRVSLRLDPFYGRVLQRAGHGNWRSLPSVDQPLIEGLRGTA